MSVAEQLLVGLELTLTGMVTVFILLTFMVFAIGWMSKLAHRLSPPAKPVPMGVAGHGETPPGSVDPATLSAITAAIHNYRSKRR
jgi:oxaloacetate decarboxylase gamma subunit